MTDQPALFEDGPAPWPELTAAERRRASVQTMLDRGVHPHTGLPLLGEPGPLVARCGTCAHRYLKGGHAKNYPKCAVGPVNDSPGTDVLARWPACNRWERAE